jgi:hypothetical protein
MDIQLDGYIYYDVQDYYECKQLHFVNSCQNLFVFF